ASRRRRRPRRAGPPPPHRDQLQRRGRGGDAGGRDRAAAPGREGVSGRRRPRPERDRLRRLPATHLPRRQPSMLARLLLLAALALSPLGCDDDTAPPPSDAPEASTEPPPAAPDSQEAEAQGPPPEEQ